MSLVDELRSPAGGSGTPGAPTPTPSTSQLTSSTTKETEAAVTSGRSQRSGESEGGVDNLAEGAGNGDTATFTLTRTRNLANQDGSGAGEVQTVTRLTTRKGDGSDGQVPVASSTLASKEGGDGTLGQVPSSQQASQPTGLANSTAAFDTGNSVPSGQTISQPNATSMQGDTSIMTPQNPVLATTTPNTDDPNLVSTFVITTGQPKTMMEVQTTFAPVSTMTNNRAAANDNDTSDSDNIFVAGNKLFPLGITVIILGSLFIIITLGILFVRFFGWNRKRKLRHTIPSFIEVGGDDYGSRGATMFDPKFETITTNRTANHHLASTNPFEPSSGDRSSLREVENGYAGVVAYNEKSYAYNDYPAASNLQYPVVERGDAATQAAYYTQPARPYRPDDLVNPFVNPPRALGSLDVPRDVSTDMGSPVPSFHTGRMAYPFPNPRAFTTNPDAPSARGSNLGRTLTNSSRDSSSTDGKSRRGDRVLGSNPTQTGLGYLSTRRFERHSNGSLGSSDGGSLYSSSSGETDRIIWATTNRPVHAAGGPTLIDGSGKLGKKAVWGSDRV